jgi:hypothetical protein
MTHWPGSRAGGRPRQQADRGVPRLSDMDIEKPPDDAFEQERDVIETDEEEPMPQRPELPFDANEADAAEQERTVETDDDDYR